MSANKVNLSLKTIRKIDFSTVNRVLGPKIDFNRLFGPKKLAACKVGCKIAFVKCREVKFTGASLKIWQPERLFYRLKSTFWAQKSTFIDKPNYISSTKLE